MLNNEIIKLSYEDYLDVYRDIEDFAKKSPSFLAIGKFGEVKNPSISDLDIFLCYKDHGFNKSRERIVNYIQNKKIANYLCSHDPLIIPQSAIKYLNKLHTLYGLDITAQNSPIIYKENLYEYNKLLENIWATFLLPILLSVIIYKKKFDDRFKLLLLKNIHQSISNFKNDERYMNKSNIIREKFLNGDITTKLIDQELFDSSAIFLENLSNINFRLSEKKTSSSYYLKKNIKYLQSQNDEISYDIHSKTLQIYLNKQLYSLVETVFNNNDQTDYNHLNDYIRTSNKVYDIFYDMEVPYPFITPFNYPFFKKGIYFKAKKMISRIIP